MRQDSATLGRWQPDANTENSHDAEGMARLLRKLDCPIFALKTSTGASELASGGSWSVAKDSRPVNAWVAPLLPSQLGEAAFRKKFGLQYACVSGSMANAIASEDLVCTMAEHGMMGFFGSAGLAPERVQAAIASLQHRLGERTFGCNLIHSPHDPVLEDNVVDIYLERGVKLIEASAFMSLTLPLVRYRYAGITRRDDGSIFTPNSVMGKVSRLELAQKFLHPASAEMLSALVERGHLTSEQAELAAQMPVGSEITAEADSGGHTDNRPAISLIPSIVALRDAIEAERGYHVPVGAAGGISTPLSAAGAFAMGASYIMTGSVNQACVESGTCDHVRNVLAKAGPADCAMAPAADMFEMGVNVQVLKWGTMFPVKARKLYNWYRQYDSFAQMPPAVITQIERDYLRQSIEASWEATKKFFARRDPAQIAKAEADPKHLMALVFRSYLGQASRWANAGEPSRRPDYQIWCGPAMGAFNEWAKGSFLEEVSERRAATIALNLLHGAAFSLRVRQLQWQGAEIPAAASAYRPQRLEELLS